jgi:hypothetical protein
MAEYQSVDPSVYEIWRARVAAAYFARPPENSRVLKHGLVLGRRFFRQDEVSWRRVAAEEALSHPAS